MRATRRQTLAMATAMLGLVLGGCGSHKDDSGPSLHGAGGSQNEPSQAPVIDTGSRGGASEGGPTSNSATPNPFSVNPSGAGLGGSGSRPASATPGSGLGFVPGESGGGMGGVLATSAP
ncbi:MAG TPA: hypothetical protein VE081_10820 [Sporichthyaceae bacterium]|nr:hypothetical protein [Sporichthyaceae bacterium]